MAQLWGTFKQFIIYYYLLHCWSINRPTCLFQTSGAPEFRVMVQGALNVTAFLGYSSQPATSEDCGVTCPSLTDRDRFQSLINASTYNLYLPMFTRRPFFSISDFFVFNFTSSSSMDSELIIKSSAYSSFHGQPEWNSLNGASYTMI